MNPVPVAAAVGGEIDYRSYLRLDMMPHILCPGCGHGIVLKSLLRAMHRLALAREDVVLVSGIGCSSRIVGYVDACTLHTTHGRPLTFATGVKLARPDLRVIVITGDGDGLAIGGNHLIHAARRNIDLTCLLLNNAIYGMTGGQGAPTTPEGARSSITPSGAVEPAFDACRLVQGAGGTFVARGLTASPLQLDDLIVAAIEHRGFSFVEILSDCPEYFGRYNDLGRGPEMLQAQRRQVEWVGAKLGEKRFVEGLLVDSPAHAAHPAFTPGVLHQEARPEYTELLARDAAGREASASRPGRRNAPAAAGTALPAPVGAPNSMAAAASRRSADMRAPASSSAGAANGAVPGGTHGPAGEVRIRVAGAGGQGVVLAGLLLAEAAVAAGRNATHAQAYGPESRGGASKAEVIIADGEIDFPCADEVDVLVALTRDAYARYAGQLAPGGLLIVDADHVAVDLPHAAAAHALPLTATAVRVLGTAVGANLVALGALAGLSGAVPVDALEHAVAARRPGGSAERALLALRAGLDLIAAR